MLFCFTLKSAHNLCDGGIISLERLDSQSRQEGLAGSKKYTTPAVKREREMMMFQGTRPKK